MTLKLDLIFLEMVHDLILSCHSIKIVNFSADAKNSRKSSIFLVKKDCQNSFSKLEDQPGQRAFTLYRSVRRPRSDLNSHQNHGVEQGGGRPLPPIRRPILAAG